MDTSIQKMKKQGRNKRDAILLLGLFLLLAGCASKRPDKIEYDHKESVVPQKWLQGKFYRLVTVHDATHHSDAQFIGEQSGTLIEAKTTKNKWIWEDLASGLNTPDKKSVPISAIEIDLVDIVRKKDDNEEETHKLNMERRKAPKDRGLAILNFEKNDLEELSVLPFNFHSYEYKCFKPSQVIRVFDKELTENSFNWKIEKVYEMTPECLKNSNAEDEEALENVRSFKIVFAYSLLRYKENTSYRAKTFPEKNLENNIVGVFTRRKTEFPGGKEKREYLIKRWDPTKKVVYTFSKNFPQDLKPGIRKIFANINDHLEKITGSRMLEIRDNPGNIDYGDLRHSMIVWVENGPELLLGYGPSHADPQTGEILNASVFIYKKAFESELSQFLDTAGLTPMQIEHPGTSSSAFDNIYSEFVRHIGQQKAAVSMGAEPKAFELKLGNKLEKDQKLRDLYAEHAVYFLDRGALQNTASKFHPFVAQTKSLDKKEIWKYLVLETFVHELLHTLGLRHNFKGTFDKAHHTIDVSDEFPNLPKALKEKLVPGGKARTSTVMEYTPPLQGAIKIGPYDEFALAYAYGDKDKDLAAKSTFLFCTDEMAYNYSSAKGIDPFCKQWDSGTSAVEIVENIWEDYKATYPLRNLRTDGNRYTFKNDLNGAYGYLGRLLISYVGPLAHMIAYKEYLENPAFRLAHINKADLLKDLGEAQKKVVAFMEEILRDDTRPYLDQANHDNVLFVRGISLDKWLVLTRGLFQSTPYIESFRRTDQSSGVLSPDIQTARHLLLQIATNRRLEGDKLTFAPYFPASHPTMKLRMAALYSAIYSLAYGDLHRPGAVGLIAELDLDLNYQNRDQSDETTVVSQPLSNFGGKSSTLSAGRGTIAGQLIETYNYWHERKSAPLAFQNLQRILDLTTAVEASLEDYAKKKMELPYHERLNVSLKELINRARESGIQIEKTLSSWEEGADGIIQFAKSGNAMNEIIFKEGRQAGKKYIDWVERIIIPDIKILITELRGPKPKERLVALLQGAQLIKNGETPADQALHANLKKLSEVAAMPFHETAQVLYNLHKFHPGGRSVSPFELGD